MGLRSWCWEVSGAFFNYPVSRDAGACQAMFKLTECRAVPCVILHEPFGATLDPLITQKLFQLNMSNLAYMLRLARYICTPNFINTPQTVI